MPDTIHTVRLAIDDIRQLCKAEIADLGLELIRIKRSNGEIEYVTENMMEYLQIRRKQRNNQRKLASMRENKYAKKPSGLRSFVKRIIGD